MEHSIGIEDRLAIEEIVQRYAVHVDLFEIDEWVDCFTQAACFDEREFEGPLLTGPEEIRAYGRRLTETVQHMLHHMTTHVIRDLTATSARGVAFAIVESVRKDGSRARHQTLYKDRYEKVDGRWLIAERVLKATLPSEILAKPSVPA